MLRNQAKIYRFKILNNTHENTGLIDDSKEKAS